MAHGRFAAHVLLGHGGRRHDSYTVSVGYLPATGGHTVHFVCSALGRDQQSARLTATDAVSIQAGCLHAELRVQIERPARDRPRIVGRIAFVFAAVIAPAQEELIP